MSAPERLAALFVTPAATEPARAPVAPVPPPPDAPAPRRPGATPAAPVLAAVPDAVPGPRVCVLGGGRAGTSFGRALAGRLARGPGTRCAVLCLLAGGDGDGPPARLPGPPAARAPAARRLARALAEDDLASEVHGRVVEVTAPGSEAEVEQVVTLVSGHAAGVPVVTVVPAARPAALDLALARQDVVVAVVAPGAPAGLAELAVVELRAAAPGAVVETVALPARAGGVARRAAVGRVLAVLR